MSSSAAPKVSVCVVTYNHERYIEACLRSLLEQVCDFDFEVIVGDDCSTDRTGEIVDAMAAADNRLRVLRPATNRGPTQNLLAVHNAARGVYIAHIDGDDLAAAGKLAMQAALLDANPRLALCGHRMKVIDETGAETGGVYPAALGERFNLGKLVRCGMPVLASSIMYRAQARTLREFDFEIFDWYLFTDIMRGGDGGFIPDVLGGYRVNSASLTASLAVAGMQERMLRLYRLRYAELPGHRPDFFAWAAFAAWTSFRNHAPISADHWRFVRQTFTPAALGGLIDAGRWILQNRTAMSR